MVKKRSPLSLTLMLQKEKSYILTESNELHLEFLSQLIGGETRALLIKMSF